MSSEKLFSKISTTLPKQVELPEQTENSCANGLQELQAEIEPVRLLRLIDFRTTPPVRTENLLMKVVTVGKNAADFLIKLDSSDLLDKKSFKQALTVNTANFSIDMKEKEFERIKQEWYNTVELTEMYACAGHQNGKFVWANACFDYKTKKLNFHQKLDETKDYNCPENSLIDTTNGLCPLVHSSEKTPRQIFQEFFITLGQYFPNSDVLMCFGVVIGTVFWDIFQRNANGFPAVFLTGEHQSGKSTLLLLLAAIFGVTDLSSLTSGDSTPYALLCKLSSRLNIPVFIEEISSDVYAKFEPFVKNAYSGISRARGKKNGLEEMKIFTSFVATSNHFFKKMSGQLLSRIMFTTMQQAQFNLDGFPYFDIEKRKELSKILLIFLMCRNNIAPIYDVVFAELQKIVPNKGRHISNLAISCTVWFLVNQILQTEMFNWRQMAIDYDTKYQSYLNSEIKSGDVIMNDISRLVETERLICAQDWKLVKGNILRLNLSRYIEKFNIANPQNLMTATQFRLAVTSDKRFYTKTTPMSGIGRAISIDVSSNEYLCLMLQQKQSLVRKIYGNNIEEKDYHDYL